jgi:hypothetical protein
MKSIRVVETVKDKQERLGKEKKLSDLRNFLSSESSDVYSKSKELLMYSKKMRRVTMTDVALELINGIAYAGEDNLESIKSGTPMVSKNLTTIIKLKEEIEDIKIKDGGSKKPSNFKKVELLWGNCKIFSDRFELSLRAMFDTAEALLNILLLSTDIIYSYSEALDLCYENKLVTKQQYNLLRMLGHIRNLFIHNSRSYIMLKHIPIDTLYMSKACVLESNTVIFKLVVNHKAKLCAFGAYLQAINKLEKGDALKQSEIDMCHRLYSEMVITDAVKGIVCVKELYSEDELENGYIKIQQNKEW